MSRVLLLSMVLWIVAGCAGVLRSDAAAPQVYVLRAAASPPRAADAQAQALESARAASTKSAAPPTLQLLRPDADPGLGSEQIVLVRSDHRMDFFAGSRWPGALQDVVETLAVDTLRVTGDWAAVHDSPSPYVADYLLQIVIRRFEADYTAEGPVPTVYVTLDCTVARRAGRELLTSFVAEGTQMASENRMAAVISAFEKAANAALAVTAQRTAEAVRTSTAQSTP